MTNVLQLPFPSRTDKSQFGLTIVITFLIVATLATILGLVSINTFTRENIQLEAYISTAEQPALLKPDRLPQLTQSSFNPTPPPAVTVADQLRSTLSVASVDLPTDELTITADAAADFEDFAEGVEDSVSNSSTASAFGSTGSQTSGLRGALYDFKQDKRGRSVAYRADPVGNFTQQILQIQKRKFSDSSLRSHFKAPLELTLTHLAIPNSPASGGPQHFGAEGLIQPSGWLAHYSGTVRVPETGRYRFVGMGDDYLTVYVDGRLRLSASWPGVQAGTKGRWEPAEEDEFNSPIGNQPLIFGDWVSLSEGQAIELDLAIGEVPGGYLGFVLLIQKEGELYSSAPDGRPILPLFTTQPFFPQQEQLIQDSFGDFAFDWQKVPVFSAVR